MDGVLFLVNGVTGSYSFGHTFGYLLDLDIVLTWEGLLTRLVLIIESSSPDGLWILSMNELQTMCVNISKNLVVNAQL